MTDSSNPPRIIRKVFICQNGDCAEKNRARALYEHLLELRASRGLDDPDSPVFFKCNLSGCLNVCKDGPILVIQPDQTLYRCRTEQELERIFRDHLVNGHPVEELITQRKDT